MRDNANSRIADAAARYRMRWAARRHAQQMARGCRGCGSAVPGRVCPDCYRCRACAAGERDHGGFDCRPHRHSGPPSNQP